MFAIFRRKDIIWLLLGGFVFGLATFPIINTFTTRPYILWQAIAFSIVANIFCTIFLVQLLKLPIPPKPLYSLCYSVLGCVITVVAGVLNYYFYGW